MQSRKLSMKLYSVGVSGCYFPEVATINEVFIKVVEVDEFSPASYKSG